MRGITSAGSPFSVTSPVGSAEAGSNVIMQTPSKGTARRRTRAEPSEKSRTPCPRCTRWMRSSRRRSISAPGRARRSRVPRAVRWTRTWRPSRSRATRPGAFERAHVMAGDARDAVQEPGELARGRGAALEVREDARPVRAEQRVQRGRRRVLALEGAPGAGHGVADRQAEVAVVVRPAGGRRRREQRLQLERAADAHALRPPRCGSAAAAARRRARRRRSASRSAPLPHRAPAATLTRSTSRSIRPAERAHSGSKIVHARRKAVT